MTIQKLVIYLKCKFNLYLNRCPLNGIVLQAAIKEKAEKKTTLKEKVEKKVAEKKSAKKSK